MKSIIRNIVVCFFCISILTIFNPIHALNIVEKVKKAKKKISWENPLYLGYYPIESVRNSQQQISTKLKNKKIEEIKTKAMMQTTEMQKSAQGKPETQEIPTKGQLLFNKNKSALSKKQALPIVIGVVTKGAEPEEVINVLVGSHEEVLAAKELGSQTIPVKAVGFFRGNVKNFWQWAVANGFISANVVHNGNIIIEKTWNVGPNEFIDNPNIYFAHLISRVCKKDGTSEGAEYPVFIHITETITTMTPLPQGDTLPAEQKKIRADVPFLELLVANVLSKEGIQYKNDMPDNLNQEPLASMVEQSRKVLFDAITKLRQDISQKDNPLINLRLVPEKTQYTKINNGDVCSYKGPLWPEKQAPKTGLSIANSTATAWQVIWTTAEKSNSSALRPGDVFTIDTTKPENQRKITSITWQTDDKKMRWTAKVDLVPTGIQTFVIKEAGAYKLAGKSGQAEKEK